MWFNLRVGPIVTSTWSRRKKVYLSTAFGDIFIVCLFVILRMLCLNFLFLFHIKRANALTHHNTSTRANEYLKALRRSHGLEYVTLVHVKSPSGLPHQFQGNVTWRDALAVTCSSSVISIGLRISPWPPLSSRPVPPTPHR